MLRSAAYVVMAALVSGLVFGTFGSIDLFVSGLFYVGGSGFPFLPGPRAALHSDFVPWLAKFVGVGIVVLLLVVLVRRRPVMGLGLRHVVFLSLSLAIGPGLIVNGLLKPYSGRPRPSEVTEFGGALAFRPAFDFRGGCPGDCSFVSGDASMGFDFVSLALLLRRRRRLAVLGAVALGAGIGMARLMAGAHFVSDVVFAGFATVLPILVLYWLIFEVGWRFAAPRPG